jgi:hypothetical protein
MCILMLQIAQTRLLSVMAWYYLAFFAISMAMFGMAAGSLFVYFRPDLFPPGRLAERLSLICNLLAISVAVSAVSLVSTVLLTGAPGLGMILLWPKLILIILPPYILGGAAIALALTRSPWPVGTVYGVDMAGAAAGCLLVLGLLSWMDGVSALLAIGAVAASASVCFRAACRRDPVGGRAAGTITTWPVVGSPMMVGLLLLGAACVNTAVQPLGIAPFLVKDHLEIETPAAQQWNSFSRIRADADAAGPPAMWGPSPRMPALFVSQMPMNIDGFAASAMYRFGGDLATVGFLKYDVTNIAYAIRGHGRAAVIGVGGGRDLLSAHLFGFKDVTGVELNPIFVDWLQTRFRAYNHLADLPGTRFFVDEARSWFARTRDRFDLIEMSLTDTWAATGAGAFSLSENGLYTVQGWQHFLNALSPGGVFTVSRWFDPQDIGETGRLLSLACAALRARGVQQPASHLFMAATGRLATLIVGNAPLSASELTRLHAATAAYGFAELVSPDHDIASPVLRRIMQASNQDEIASLVRLYHVDFTAPTDNRPFFFNQLILTDLASIAQASKAQDGVIYGNLLATRTIANIVVISALLVLLVILLPSLPSLRQTKPRLAGLGTAYFALVGLGFMFVEISLIQRVSLFLGHPVYGLAVALFGIILSTGLGSLLSERVGLGRAWKLMAWASMLPLLLVSLTVFFPALTTEFEGAGIFTRVLVALGCIVPPGLLMGFGFPTGMRLAGALDQRPTPWFWAVNGAAGVLGTSLAVATSIAFSIDASICLGAACYLLAGPIGVLLARMDSRHAASDEPALVQLGSRLS